MCDGFKPPGTRHGRASSAQLARIAEVLGVPVESFFRPEAGRGPAMDGPPPEAEDLIPLIGAYLAAADVEARRHFVAAVAAMAESAGD